MTTETLMTWADVLADPSLHHLPYKIELTDEGKIVMSPAGKTHAKLQFQIGEELRRLHADGQVLTEIAVQCQGSLRVIVADVAWVSDSRWAQYPEDGALPIAPEICVEIQSPSNTDREMAEKTALYLQSGAQEVWIVKLDGTRRVCR